LFTGGPELRYDRVVFGGLELLALLQNAKYPWVLHLVLGVPIIETFVQECCNGYGLEKFYAGTIITSDCLMPACELVQFAKVFSAKHALPALFKYLCDGNKYFRFGVLGEPMGFTNTKNQCA
jgi:hypothetical protein